ncbi:MAG: hypothetical protein JSR99_05650 [Proteobacteria bacterium]|nr:hypothetical protein [Pseudomonadota bacterium]
MDLSFTHPHWIVAGVLLLLGGFWLFRWGRRNDDRDAIAAAATEAAINKLRKNSPGKTRVPPPPAAKIGAAARFRNAMAQFLGIVGLLMIIAGPVLIVFGIFYTAG